MDKKVKLCSACLLGINCRYDGKIKSNKKVLALAKKEILIPVCPEQLGGQATPRPDAEIVGNKVLEPDGTDITKEFKKGAREVLKIAKLFGVKEAILKQRSPSCGSGQIYDGSFSHKIIKGDGITTWLLKKHDIKIISEEEL
ncbi:DUF523 domain-containing protein [Candidatus Berkelbacteria bacterium CG_4_9_14_0_2_um_filter_42_30]|uniref:DUF523 domain-containing protein n=6 Tax=Candidatus Berkelbacteria TaxID=1618330 RepID=A0A2M7K1J1_9BACT|nr:MAG: purine-nucleoside phosphorylase [Candidatus Berkelbacteria bacterium CG1_02_42_45]PIP51032.1 MAG: purine-nucleoside phosphorylase [Candidatus Berkelbacteria bacterium CG23_combo_of_CG06-09_8_20_14_all_41_73]PIR27053.1 MAG: purine-nucleoside phosphorylase [Candidatus Berkelbacteria bacterium CG11_big_fil_rev_8_21_14_0_20_42_15]PIX30132.1 MAG: DUF523 domain-containing protein [Candidatus Berkelbacteria bacterium CG_4_8_14_3_um_filter_42_13]PIZ27737.1 MAG: DUF523 domain-containing protein 